MNTEKPNIYILAIISNDKNFRYLDGNFQWVSRYPMRKSTKWVKRITEECMLGLPVSYPEGFDSEPLICKNIPAEYAETFSRELKMYNKFANTVIWC